MRNIKIIELQGGRIAEVKELSVKDVRRLVFGMVGVDIKNILGDRFQETVALLGDCVQLPDDELFDDLSFTDANKVFEAFTELNQSFLDLLGLNQLLQSPLLAVIQTQPDSSTTPVSS